MWKPNVGLWSVLLMGMLAAGCGSGKTPERAKVYKTVGKVTYLGSPLIGGVVTFSPQDHQPPAIARTNDNGEFALSTYGGGDGAAVGEYKVLVMLIDAGGEAAPTEAHSTEPGWSPPNSHSAKSAKKAAGSLLPPKFSDLNQTPLTAKVAPNGDNQFTFELK